MNRNVRDFLALYKNHFRFISPDDIPRGKVRHAILVDPRRQLAQRHTARHRISRHRPRTTLAEHNLMSEARKVLPQAHDLWCGATSANTAAGEKN